MKFEVVEEAGVWIVCRDGSEVARHGDQDHALADVAERIRSEDREDARYSVAVRYQARR